MRKTAFCICENKDADQLRGNSEADQRLPLFPKYKISSFWISSVAVQPGLCGTWSETPKTGFLTTRFNSVQCFSLLLVIDVNFYTVFTWPLGYKTFFMLNSAEHEIYPAHKN